MSTYFDAPVSGTGNGTIAISTKTLNNGSSVRGAVLSISNGEKTANSTLSQRFKPIFRRNGSGDISGSGGTMSVSVNSSYPFWFRNNPDNVSAITYGNTDYKNVNPISSGSYTFNVSIMGNSSSARTDTLEMAFQKINGSYSFNNPDATDFQIVYSQESGSTPTPPEPPTPSGTSINVPIFFDSDEVNIWIGLGQALPFVLRPSVVIEHNRGNRELINYVIPISETAITFDDGNNQPFYVSDFDTSSLDYISIAEVYAGSGAPAYTVTYGDTEYYIYWSEDYSANFRTYLENVGNNCLDDVVWGTEPSAPIDYSNEYFTVEAISAGTLSWSAQGTHTALKAGLEYSKNEGQWKRWYSASTVSLVEGDTVRFRGNSGVTYDGKVLSMNTNGRFNVYGNIMSLLYGDNFSGQTTLTSDKVFGSLFSSSKVVSAKNLILPATALTQYCYSFMFEYCYYLTEAPALPATTLANYCYKQMFYNCTSLVEAPELPATNLKSDCYEGMFEYCTHLVNAPALPTTDFQGQGGCYNTMFKNCSALVNAPALPATALTYYCYEGMFQNCSSLQTAPELPAPTLTRYCYRDMFNGCTNLNYIKCLATDISASLCLSNWVLSVQTNSGTFIKDANMTGWGTGNSGIPNGWAVESI